MKLIFSSYSELADKWEREAEICQSYIDTEKNKNKKEKLIARKNAFEQCANELRMTQILTK